MTDREHTRVIAEHYTRLARIARDIVEQAEVSGEHAIVPRHLLRRLERELQGRPQPQGMWMGIT